MANSALPPVYLMLILVLCPPGYGPIPALTQDCNAGEKVVSGGGALLIYHTNDIKYYRKDSSSSIFNLYVKTEPGFAGFHVSVMFRGEIQQSAWFPADRDCFPRHGQWYEMKLGAGMYKDQNTLSIGYATGTCVKECHINTNLPGMWAVNVTAHGASKWLLEGQRGSCDYIQWKAHTKLKTFPTCIKPPYSAFITTVIVLSVVGSVVVIVVVIVVVTFMCRRSKQNQQLATSTTGEPTSPSQPSEPASKLRTIENELYEPYNKYGGTVNVSPRHEGALYVIENDIYEPFNGYEHGYGQKQEATCSDQV